MCMPDYANFNIENNKNDKKIENIENKNNSKYQTLKTHTHYGIFCNYKKKSIIVAGLLELFLPLGLGHFYAGHLLLGWLKLSYNLIIYTFGCFLHLKSTWNDSETYFDLIVLCIIFSCLIPIWYILDLLS